MNDIQRYRRELIQKAKKFGYVKIIDDDGDSWCDLKAGKVYKVMHINEEKGIVYTTHEKGQGLNMRSEGIDFYLLRSKDIIFVTEKKANELGYEENWELDGEFDEGI